MISAKKFTRFIIIFLILSDYTLKSWDGDFYEDLKYDERDTVTGKDYLPDAPDADVLLQLWIALPKPPPDG